MSSVILKQKVKEILPRELLDLIRPRSFHAFCVGAEKTGTTSVAEIFQGTHRVGHDSRWDDTTHHMLLLYRNAIAREAFCRYLVKRDKQLWLELESSCLMGYCAPHLITIFPRAKFVLTIRDCFSWLKSIINHQKTHKRVNPGLDRWHCVEWEPQNFEYSPHDEPLGKYGLFPLDCFLNHWTKSITRVTESIPSEQLLIIKTKDIGNSVEYLAKFLGLSDNECSSFERKHSNQQVVDHKILEQIDEQYVADRCWELCGDQMQKFFPDFVESEKST